MSKIRSLTPRQLLILVLTTARDCGYPVVSKTKVVEIIRDMRTFDCAVVPQLPFSISGQKSVSRDLEQAFSDLHQTGASFDPVEGTITVADELSCAPIYKPLHDADREALEREMSGYCGEFVRRLSFVMPPVPPARPDPRTA